MYRAESFQFQKTFHFRLWLSVLLNKRKAINFVITLYPSTQTLGTLISRSLFSGEGQIILWEIIIIIKHAYASTTE
jgi:hypothetical protein